MWFSESIAQFDAVQLEGKRTVGQRLQRVVWFEGKAVIAVG